MRKVVLGLGISLDGYIARPDGSVDFLFMPKDFCLCHRRVDRAARGTTCPFPGLPTSFTDSSRVVD